MNLNYLVIIISAFGCLMTIIYCIISFKNSTTLRIVENEFKCDIPLPEKQIPIEVKPKFDMLTFAKTNIRHNLHAYSITYLDEEFEITVKKNDRQENTFNP